MINKIAQIYSFILKQAKLDDEQKDLYKRWKKLVNMSPSELEKFIDSEDGKKAGFSREEAAEYRKKNKGSTLGSGRDSARAILRMKDKSVEDWTTLDWKWCKRQVSFISRTTGQPGPLYDDKGRKTRKHLALLIWGHNPEKK